MSKGKKNEHTGFRNGQLFCFNCGGSFNLQLPIAVSVGARKMEQFESLHSDCPKTWTEPILDTNGKTERECADWWLIYGERGISSLTMFKHLDGRDFTRGNEWPPSDPDDFKRCYKLLEAVPQWKDQLHKMKPVSPGWEKLVDNWDKLTEMYEQNVRENWKNYKKIGMYEFMKSLGC